MKSCLCLEILRILRKIKEITMKINVYMERKIFLYKNSSIQFIFNHKTPIKLLLTHRYYFKLLIIVFILAYHFNSI